MKFKSAENVRTVIEAMRDTDIESHSFNRAKINELFEGFPPFTEDEMVANNRDTNVNFLEPARIAHSSRSTWNNAFLKPGNFFTVKLDSGPKHKRGSWGHKITRGINRIMKNSLPYIETIRATGASVVLHGIGPKRWERARCWRPDEIGIEDLMIPTNTRVKLDNLTHYGVYREHTPESLFRMTHGKRVDPGWNQSLVNKELARVSSEILGTSDNYQDTMSPEKLVRLFKQNSGYFSTDVVPTIKVWDFYYQEDDDEKGCWYRKMLLADTEYEGDGFLYDARRPYAHDLSQILHIQFGDGANVAPFLYHTVRSLGFLLFGICHLQNRTRCGFFDAVQRAMLEFFRIHGGDDRARMQRADLVNLGIVPDGLEFVPRDQRWQVDEALVGAALSQNRQLMSENASAFVQDVDQGGGKELTATEVMARLNSANTLVASLLSMAYTYAKFEYKEICRRFTLKDSGDRDIEKFRTACLKAGIPETYLNVERWEIEPERTMGGGNKTLEIAQAKSMMEVRSLFDSEAQREVLRDYTLAITDDPDKAERWVPTGERSITKSEHDAQLAVGTLMQMAPVGVLEGIDHIGYVEAFLLSLRSLMEDISVLGGPSPQQLGGLTACFKHVSQHIAIIAQSEENRELAKRYNDFLKPIMNQVRAWGAQMQQAAQAAARKNGDGGEGAAKTQAMLLQAQTKAKISEATAAQKMRQKDVAFAKEQRRKDAQVMVQTARDQVLTQAEVEKTDKLTAADIASKRAQAAASESQSEE